MNIICYICNRPVDIMKARSGDGGKPCHSECYTGGLKWNQN